MTRMKNRGKPSVSGSVAKELKRYVSAAVAPREEHRKLSFPLSLFPLLDAEEKDFLILYISCSHFASSRLGSPSLFFLLFSSSPPLSLSLFHSLLPFSLVLRFIHSLPSYRASFVFVVKSPFSQRLFRISFSRCPAAEVRSN